MIYQDPMSEKRINHLLNDSYVLHAFNYVAHSERARKGSMFEQLYAKNCVVCSLQSLKSRPEKTEKWCSKHLELQDTTKIS